MSKQYLFTSESVSEGHPDKVADQISDAILDAHLKIDQFSRVACETLIAKNLVVIAGEISSEASIDFREVVSSVLKNIGYSDSASGFDTDNFRLELSISKQAGEIAGGVFNSGKSLGAGDQGLMFGYAVRETPELFPLPISLSNKLLIKLRDLRKSNAVSFLRPDAKSQVTIKYEGNIPVKVEKVVISTQHSPDVDQSVIKEFIIEDVIKNVIPQRLISDSIQYLINPSGSFVEGGPLTDTGLTGRKIIVDTYGGSCAHGGGAFSGKDATKVDRSAAYAARYVAKNIVASGIARSATVQLAYAIGYPEPVSFYIKTQGNGRLDDSQLASQLLNIFDLSPSGIIEQLDLRRPIFGKTAAYGHFGREDSDFTWENTDKATVIRDIYHKNQRRYKFMEFFV